MPVGGVRCWKWITGLQQAELLAIVKACQLVAQMGWRKAYVGSDSFVARGQSSRMRGAALLSW